MASIPYSPLAGTQSRPTATHLCPECDSRLYGAHGISARPAALVWVCRTPGCGYTRGMLAPSAHRCLCNAVVIPGTGREFQGPEGLVHICSGCSDVHPGGAPKHVLDQHARIERARQQRSNYRFEQATEHGLPVVRVHKIATADTYTVTPNAVPVRCTCPDYRGRCAGTALACKHIPMALEWLSEQPEQATAAPSLEDRLADLERRRSEAQRALDERVAAERAALLAEYQGEEDTEARPSLEEELRLGDQDEERWARYRRERDILWPDA